MHLFPHKVVESGGADAGLLTAAQALAEAMSARFDRTSGEAAGNE